MDTTSAPYCIIGAGASGLTAAKNLKQYGIPFEIIEAQDDVGGNWYYGTPRSSVYRSVHMISSKRFSEYTDFPMPEHYPAYCNQAQAWEYLRSYARAFGLYEHIEFNRTVEKVDPVDGGRHWEVRLDNGEARRYSGVIIANGHLWCPRIPTYPGSFDGIALHSSQYKTADVLRDKRVLIIGAGNSGCDIAVESCQHAANTFHSTRRGYYYWPKYLFGVPADVMYEFVLKMRLPLWVRRFFGGIMLRLFIAGNPADYGLPKPDHKLFEEHFIVNSTLLYHLGHGDITPKRDVRELCGNRVLFADGSEETIDVIIYATGFKLTEFPFIDPAHLNWATDQPQLFLNVFHPRYDNLFVIGMFQTSTGNWPLMDYQAQLVSRFIHAQDHHPERARAFRTIKAGRQPRLNGGIKYIDSGRHALEVEYFAYRAFLKKQIAKLDVERRPRSRRAALSSRPVPAER